MQRLPLPPARNGEAVDRVSAPIETLNLHGKFAQHRLADLPYDSASARSSP
jgi:hypothetical protein